MDDRPSNGAELRLLEHLQHTAPHPAIREPRPIVLGELAQAVGLTPDTCRVALHGLQAAGRIALRIHDGGLVEIRPLSDPSEGEAPVRRLR